MKSSETLSDILFPKTLPPPRETLDAVERMRLGREEMRVKLLKMEVGTPVEAKIVFDAEGSTNSVY